SFSSRSRHTRFSCDWSSDVCSSDLPREQIEGNAPKGENYLLEVDNEMVVPVGKKIRVITTAADVVHAWWVPAFGVKQDAIPGFQIGRASCRERGAMQVVGSARMAHE